MRVRKVSAFEDVETSAIELNHEAGAKVRPKAPSDRAQP